MKPAALNWTVGKTYTHYRDMVMRGQAPRHSELRHIALGALFCEQFEWMI